VPGVAAVLLACAPVELALGVRSIYCSTSANPRPTDVWKARWRCIGKMMRPVEGDRRIRRQSDRASSVSVARLI
jgi:hypothetical protein